jgi:hypothetical protein
VCIIIYVPFTNNYGDKPRSVRWLGYVAYMGMTRKASKLLVVKCEGKTPLGRQRRKWRILNNLKGT